VRFRTGCDLGCEGVDRVIMQTTIDMRDEPVTRILAGRSFRGVVVTRLRVIAARSHP
jgi:hypothetical protein